MKNTFIRKFTTINGNTSFELFADNGGAVVLSLHINECSGKRTPDKTLKGLLMDDAVERLLAYDFKEVLP